MRAGNAPLARQSDAAEQRETRRLEALDRYDILDTPAEAAFDRIARLVKNIFNVEIAVVSLIDAHRQWHKAMQGVGDNQLELKDTFCRFAIQQDQPLIVPDAKLDARFANNPLVTGAPRIRSYAGAQLRTAEGHNIGTVCAIDSHTRAFSDREVEILSDLAQIAMDELELRMLAATDVLTALPSRRAFKTEASRAVALAVRHKHALACIALDLDHFKRINDTHGHAAGDHVLVRLAEVIRRHIRKTDLVGRVGGEEFSIVLPHTDVRGAAEVAENLRAEIETLRFNFGNVNAGITASLGIAQLDSETADLDALLAHADAALYQAKGAGRNRVVVRQSFDRAGTGTRRRVLKAGRVLFNKRHSVIDCTVRWLAEDGAGIDVATSAGIPESFVLSIPADRLEAECRITHQSDRHVEVLFV